MNAKDLALVEQMIKDALAPHIAAITELEQRSSNFATRVNASNKMYRAEITLLRSRVEDLTPAVKVPPRARLTRAQWDAATASLCVKLAPKTFFAPSDVHAEHALLSAPVQAKAIMAPVAEVNLEGLMEEEVSL